MNEIVYVIIAENDEDTWIQSICRDNLTAEESCAKLNAENLEKDTWHEYVKYYIEEHEVY